MSFDLDTLRAAIEAHGRVARVVVAETRGSVPREVGAAMLVWAGGQSGTIGGGALEFEAAKQALRGTGMRTVPLGPSLGQCCGGSVTLVTEVFESAPEVAQTYSRRITGTQEKPLSIRRLEGVARSGRAADTVFENGWLAESVSRAKHPLWIFGAGHVGRALVDVIAPLPEFDITWVDTGPERFPETEVKTLPAANPADSVQLAPVDAHHLILTYSHALDLELCHRLLGHSFASAGLIGSATKWARFRARLRQLGHADAQIDRITCPIGDPGLGKHPQAIAVGVASRLLLSIRRTTLGEGTVRDNAASGDRGPDQGLSRRGRQ